MFCRQFNEVFVGRVNFFAPHRNLSIDMSMIHQYNNIWKGKTPIRLDCHLKFEPLSFDMLLSILWQKA